MIKKLIYSVMYYNLNQLIKNRKHDKIINEFCYNVL